MKHTITVERQGVRLRPVRLEDASFIVKLRNSPTVQGMVGDSAADVMTQESWLNRYFARDNDYYFIVETARNNQPVGTIGIYDIDKGTGEWGRWIVLPNTAAGAASAWLALHVGFDLLKLDAMLGHVVSTNKRTLAFHQAIGNPCIGLSPSPRIIGGQPTTLVAYRAEQNDWPKISACLDRFIPDLTATTRPIQSAISNTDK